MLVYIFSLYLFGVTARLYAIVGIRTRLNRLLSWPGWTRLRAPALIMRRATPHRVRDTGRRSAPATGKRD